MNRATAVRVPRPEHTDPSGGPLASRAALLVGYLRRVGALLAPCPERDVPRQKNHYARVGALALVLLLAGRPMDRAFGDAVPLPRGARIDANAQAGLRVVKSSLDFVKTVAFYRHYLDRNRIPHQRVPTYTYRGVMIARFLATDPEASFAAIQVYSRDNWVKIAIIPPAPNVSNPPGPPKPAGAP